MAVQGGQTGPGGANGVESKTLSPGDISEKVPRTYVVTWWSAHSVQQASMRRAVLSNLRPASEQDNFKPIDTPFYQVMIYGPDMSVFQKRGNKSFIDKAYLQPKGTKSKIMPAKVEFETAPDGRVTASIFSFPKKDEHGEDTIAKNEKHVDFYCNIADVWLKTFFEPDKMVAASGPDW
ncbi:MAG: hypothetical protein ACRD50_13705 [Candidatus Acidiferrales bacterium]